MNPLSMETVGNIKVLRPSCNPSTVYDGRGGIFTWVPQDDIKEFNLLYFKPGKSRGNHYHPEFNEYFLVVDGSGVMVTREDEESPEEVIHMSKGMCVRTPAGTSHAFYAITEVSAIAMLTKPWDDCDEPIVRLDVINPAYFNPAD
jgi:mannose-6-phosphate isomerase-like protein (cupin superfamily)